MQISGVTRVTVRATFVAGVFACATWIVPPTSAGDKAMTPIKASQEPAAIPVEQFVKLHMLIKPQPGELRFHEIPWLIDVWEARKKAAALGKPILVWSGAGGSPVAVC
jgi:hypothetical protein